MNNVETVSVIIANYNGVDLLQECLPTVINQDWSALEIIIVDDASTDQSVAMIKSGYPDIKLIALDKNIGYAGVNNIGVEYAKGNYIFLINNDIRLPKNCITQLMSALSSMPDCAVIGPKVNNLNMDMKDYPLNGTMSLTGTIIQNVFSDPTMMFGIAGCAVLYRKDYLGKPFDADYGFFHEDVYLSWRARLLGYDIKRLPQIEVSHIGSASVDKLGDQKRFLTERNRLLNYRIFYSDSLLRRVWPLMLMARWIEWWADLLNGRSGKPVRKARKWISQHRALIQDKRKNLQEQRKVGDEDIIKWMSGKVSNSQHWLVKIANLKALVWCRLVGLKTWELK